MRVGLLVMALVMALGFGAVAQEASPEPPPWFGGRVEMPEYGFAVTLPDDWVAFDPAADAPSQAAAAVEALDLTAWPIDEADFVGMLAAVEDLGFHLLSQNATSTSSCVWTAAPVSAVTAEQMARLVYDS